MYIYIHSLCNALTEICLKELRPTLSFGHVCAVSLIIQNYNLVSFFQSFFAQFMLALFGCY